MKNIKTPLITGLIIIIMIMVLAVIMGNKNSGMILFYGNTCPHCKAVEDYIAANNVRSKFKFQELEVYQNQDNAALLGQYARRCGIDTNQIGVPLFFTGQKCLVGEIDIINYFKQQ